MGLPINSRSLEWEEYRVPSDFVVDVRQFSERPPHKY